MSLRRELGAGSAVLITVGAMIGSGVFVTPHEVATRVGSPGLTLALWALGGALALLGALSFAELGAAVPEAGGLYVYLRRAFGPAPAFLFGWAMLVVLVPSSLGFFAQSSARNALALLHAPPRWETPVAVGVVVALVGVNLLGVRGGALVQDAATVLKFAGVAAVAALGLWVAPDARAHEVVPRGTWRGAAGALVSVLWAYDGWIDVTSVAGEVRHPARDVPRSLLGGTAVVTVLYLAVNVAYLRVLGPAGLAASETPAVDAAARAFGAAGRTLVGALVAVSTFGGCAVALLTGSRVIYAVARDGLFLRAFGHTSARGVPDRAVAVCGALAVVFLTSRVGKLGDVFVIGAWPFYAAGALATVALRRKEPALARPHRTVGYPVTNVVFAVASFALVASYAISDGYNTALSLGAIALGGPVYAAIAKRKP